MLVFVHLLTPSQYSHSTQRAADSKDLESGLCAINNVAEDARLGPLATACRRCMSSRRVGDGLGFARRAAGSRAHQLISERVCAPLEICNKVRGHSVAEKKSRREYVGGPRANRARPPERVASCFLPRVVLMVDGSKRRWGTMSRKTTALVLLTVQNASVSLLTRQSRRRARGVAMYSPAVAVFVAEVMKAAVSITMLALEKRRIAQTGSHKKDGRPARRKRLWEFAWQGVVDTASDRTDVMRLCVPAALYAVQNVLLYIALSNLSAPTYASTYQLKLLTAALFSVLFFQRALSLRKWIALFILTAGVAVVQMDNLGESASSASSSMSKRKEDPRVGFAAILAACVSSGLAGSWFEYVLKSTSSASTSTSTPTKSSKGAVSTPSLWARNIQLSFPSLVFSFAGVVLSADRAKLVQDGPLRGFTPLVWSVVANQAVGGLLVALVTREADSVAKGFATSMAIVCKSLPSTCPVKRRS